MHSDDRRSVKFDLDKESVRELRTAGDDKHEGTQRATASCCVGCDTAEASTCRGRSGCSA